MGLVDSESSLAKAEKVTVSCFCRRRLPVVLVRLKMAPSVKERGVVEDGDVRVGPRVVRDPAFLVTRSMEDFVTWSRRRVPEAAHRPVLEQARRPSAPTPGGAVTCGGRGGGRGG